MFHNNMINIEHNIDISEVKDVTMLKKILNEQQKKSIAQHGSHTHKSDVEELANLEKQLQIASSINAIKNHGVSLEHKIDIIEGNMPSNSHLVFGIVPKDLEIYNKTT